MSDIQNVKDFNTQLSDLLMQFISITNDIDLIAYKSLYDELLKMNFLIPIQNFKKFVIPFKDQIINEDAKYFLENESYLQGVKKEESLLKALKLKDLYKKLNDTGRKNLWDYLKILCYYADEYVDDV
jgi:hypothetical protein